MTRRPRIAIAIGRNRLYIARWLRGEPTMQAIIVDDALAGACAQTREALGQAFEGEKVRAQIILLPDLAPTRVVSLPNVKPATASTLVARAPGKFFPQVGPAVTVVATPLSRTRNASTFLVSAVDTLAIDSLHDALCAAGIHSDGMLPAVYAWARVSRSGVTEVVTPSGHYAIDLKRGRIMDFRRTFQPSPDGVMLVAEADATRLMRGAHGPLLLPTPISASNARDGVRATVLGRAAMAALVFTGCAAQLLDVRRELADVRAERNEVRKYVRSGVDQTNEVERMRLWNAEILTASAASTERSRVLVQIAHALPADAALSSARFAGDTLTLEGTSPDAAATFAALKTNAFPNLQVPLPVQRIAGGKSEQFVFQAVGTK